jgi:AcrR family transcriptional regulator
VEHTDHRKGPRRRGDELNRAIFTAALDELTEHGYQRLTMERIAERARTSKASLYRRWPSRVELVLEALINNFPVDDPPNTGDLRSDLLTALHAMAAALDSPLGRASKAMMTELHPDMAATQRLRSQMIDRRNQLFLDMMRRAATRGQLRPEALTHRVAAVGPALIREHFMHFGTPIPDEVITQIVDQVLLPLMLPH